MAPALKLFFVAVLFFIAKSYGQLCDPYDIEISQTTVGGSLTGDHKFEVQVKNTCTCSQEEVRVAVSGFGSVTPVDPKLFREDGNAYLVNDAKPIGPGGSVNFTYWWDHAATFTPSSSLPKCV